MDEKGVKQYIFSPGEKGELNEKIRNGKLSPQWPLQKIPQGEKCIQELSASQVCAALLPVQPFPLL